MPEWNQAPNASPSSLDNVIENILLKLKALKGGTLLVLVAFAVVAVVWTGWFTVQPDERI